MPININLIDPVADKLPANTMNIAQIVEMIFRIVIELAGAILLLMFLFGGVHYLTAGGSDEATEKAKKAMLNAAIGMAIVLASFGIGTWYLNLLGGTGGAGGGNPPPAGETVTVSARIIDRSDGTPINNAAVMITGNSGRLTSNDHGITDTTTVEKGNHRIRAGASGYERCSDTYLINGDQTIVVRLSKTGSSAPNKNDCR